MATPMLMYGRKHQHGLNWITAIAMTGFHIGETGPDSQDTLWLRGGFPRSYLAPTEPASVR